MYLDLSFKKIFLIAFILVTISLSTFLTFFYKDMHFGDIRLPTAFARLTQKEFLYFKYLLRSQAPDRSASLAALSSFPDQGTAAATAVAKVEAIPVLVYHELVTEADGDNITDEQFADQMFALKRAGWDAITLKELEGFMDGTLALTGKPFLLTFDDGARDSYYPVDPVLRVLDFNAVSFVLPKRSDDEGSYYYLSAGEVRSMLKSGRWEIGSHGQNGHDELLPLDEAGKRRGAYLASRLWLPKEGRIETVEEFQARVGNDLLMSRDNLEKTFGTPIREFAFPFGEFGQTSIDVGTLEALQVVTSAAYTHAFYQTFRGDDFSYNYHPAEGANALMVKRIRVPTDWDGEELLAELERGFPKTLPYGDIFSSDRGWFATWGDYAVAENALRLDTTARESGTSVILDGTGHWEDYRFKAKVHSPNRTGVLLWVRYADRNNNAACNFGNGFIHVEEIIAGERKVTMGVREKDIAIPADEFTVEARVTGRTLICLLNGVEMVRSEFLTPSLSRGGIGMKIWDAELGKSSLAVKEIEVFPITPTEDEEDN